MGANNRYELCCIGHITKDKIINPRNIYYQAGGASFYLSNAVRAFDDLNYRLFTSVGESEYNVIDDLRELSIDVSVLKSEQSVFFENIYGDDPGDRTQRVLAKAPSFTIDFLRDIQSDIIHIGALLTGDFPPEIIKFLSNKGKISVDSQGFLRDLKENNVIAVDWKEKKELLKHVHFLKVNEHESKTLTGMNNIIESAVQIHEWGVKEVIITLGASGSVIYNGCEFHLIPAYRVKEAVDATGCGDTYMGGYLYKRTKGGGIDDAGHFGAAMASLKIQHRGPFRNSIEDIYGCIGKYPKTYPGIKI